MGVAAHALDECDGRPLRHPHPRARAVAVAVVGSGRGRSRSASTGRSRSRRGCGRSSRAGVIPSGGVQPGVAGGARSTPTCGSRSRGGCLPRPHRVVRPERRAEPAAVIAAAACAGPARRSVCCRPPCDGSPSIAHVRGEVTARRRLAASRSTHEPAGGARGASPVAVDRDAALRSGAAGGEAG